MDSARPRPDRFEADLRRTVDRLRGLGLPRLAAAFEPEPTRADAARGVVQRLADLAAGLGDDDVRVVPRLADHAVGDQVAVCGRDLLDAALAHPSPRADHALDEGAALLLDLRRRV
jgi:hypothetical protein